MAAAKLFLLPEELDRWMDKAGISVDNDKISLPDFPAPFKLASAVYFTKMVAGDDDTKALVGKVEETAMLEKKGCEHYQNSVLVGECAYEVKEGFLIWHESREEIMVEKKAGIARVRSGTDDEYEETIIESTQLDDIKAMGPLGEPQPALQARPVQTTTKPPPPPQSAPSEPEDEKPEDLLKKLLLEKLK
ncbi:MAG: hypothetical protein ABIJ56_04200 [Pseudomonadota bacterium]